MRIGPRTVSFGFAVVKTNPPQPKVGHRGSPGARFERLAQHQPSLRAPRRAVETTNLRRQYAVAFESLVDVVTAVLRATEELTAGADLHTGVNACTDDGGASSDDRLSDVHGSPRSHQA